MFGIGLHQSLKGVGVVAFLGAALGMSQGALAQTYSWPHWSVVDRDHYRGPSGNPVYDTYEAGIGDIGEPAARQHKRDHYRAPSGHPVHHTYEAGIGDHGRHR